jgi:hypothetical protein
MGLLIPAGTPIRIKTWDDLITIPYIQETNKGYYETEKLEPYHILKSGAVLISAFKIIAGSKQTVEGNFQAERREIIGPVVNLAPPYDVVYYNLRAETIPVPVEAIESVYGFPNFLDDVSRYIYHGGG